MATVSTWHFHLPPHPIERGLQPLGVSRAISWRLTDSRFKGQYNRKVEDSETPANSPSHMPSWHTIRERERASPRPPAPAPRRNKKNKTTFLLQSIWWNPFDGTNLLDDSLLENRHRRCGRGRGGTHLGKNKIRIPVAGCRFLFFCSFFFLTLHHN